MMRMMKV